ncbi:Protein of unknown function, partial [Gryllus bimaculatus]
VCGVFSDKRANDEVILLNDDEGRSPFIQLVKQFSAQYRKFKIVCCHTIQCFKKIEINRCLHIIRSVDFHNFHITCFRLLQLNVNIYCCVAFVYVKSILLFFV